MEDLREATRQRIHLAVLEGVDVVYVEIVGANLLSVGSRTGGRFPAHATGVGKALLAYSPAAVVQARIDAGLPRLTPDDHDAGALQRDLRQTRTRGFAQDREESRRRLLRRGARSSAVTPRCGLPCPSRAGRPRSTRPASACRADRRTHARPIPAREPSLILPPPVTVPGAYGHSTARPQRLREQALQATGRLVRLVEEVLAVDVAREERLDISVFRAASTMGGRTGSPLHRSGWRGPPR